MRAFAYYRTSSTANVGEDKDSLDRQREAVEAHAKQQGIELLASYYDAGVSGTALIEHRRGFGSLLDNVASAGVEAVLIESPTRFARDLTVQLAGHEKLKKIGLNLIPVDMPGYFLEETPTSEMVRQILGAVSQFDKSSLVLKLKHGRDAKRKKYGKCEGRKSIGELHPEIVREAKRLRRKSPKTGKRLSYRKIAEQLAQKGYLTTRGNVYSATMIQRLIS